MIAKLAEVNLDVTTVNYLPKTYVIKWKLLSFIFTNVQDRAFTRLFALLYVVVDWELNKCHFVDASVELLSNLLWIQLLVNFYHRTIRNISVM